MRKKSEIMEAFAPKEALNEHHSFYMVGIGGAGMSGLAQMLHHRGFRVSGSDSTASPVTAELEAEGIRVRIGHAGEGIEAGDAVILTDAIDLSTNPEVARARELGCPIFRRSQLLGWLLKDKKVIAITGTHGKTTTTGMTGAGFRYAGHDPLIVVGAAVPEFGGAVVEGAGEFAVVEACEAYDSFHDLDPYIVVLTNLELDHVDFHGNYENLLDSVVRFVSRLPEDGTLIYCKEDAGARDVAERFPGKKRGYDLKDRATPQIPMPGRHNHLNMWAALEAGAAAGVDVGEMWKGVQTFRGAERRLQVMRDGPIVVVDDYAHHPSEIRASLSALKDRYPDRRLVVVYQPHLYSRTEPLIPEFAEALSIADQVVVTDIYPAREDPIPGVSSARIAERIKKPVQYISSRHLLPRKVAQMTRPGDLVVGMGAGNIAEFVPAFMQELDRSGSKKVAVIYGGDSAEREVSILSGRSVATALRAKGYEVMMVDMTERLLSKGTVQPFVGSDRPDVAFLAVHGTHAEDGAIQGFLELLHIPYTGSGIQASALAMDKRLTKQILEAAGLPTPSGQFVRDSSEEIGLHAPLIVKPNAQGSTVGLSFVERDEDLPEAIRKAFQYDDAALVEEWIKGMEISVPVLGDRALLPVEIAPVGGFYDFESKYTPGAAEEIVPARLPDALIEKSQDYALRAHRALGCAGATRTDMMVRGDDIFVLEVNTLPGMTGTSLIPNSAKASGIPFEELVDWIVQDALRRHGAKA